MSPKSWLAREVSHPGATLEEIQDEPDWTAGHSHRIGFKTHDDRRAGFITGGPDDELTDSKIVEAARRKFELLRGKARKGELINFRDVVKGMTDFHLLHPERRAVGWRYMLGCTEDEVKYGQEWPANVKRQQRKEEADKKKKEEKEDKEPREGKVDKGREEEQGTGAEEEGPKDETELSFVQELRKESEHIASLENNDGTGKSPQAIPRKNISIDQVDQYTPDHWFPRHPDLVRNTGAHPMNAEPPLTQLFDAGLITPNHLHYVRNHGSVPFLVWEFHEIEVVHAGETLTVSMEALQADFTPINIPVVMACDGNRRKELNTIRKSKGFGWGAGVVGCAYWKGPLLRDVLLAAGVPDPADPNADLGGKRWINFEGAEDLAEGRYTTCIPLEYAMDPTNDVILAYHMNDLPLPPDHGFPVRVVVPGYVGGRSVKWLRRMWTSDEENDSHYHVWDNRVLPSFVTDDKGPVAETLFRHPSTACNEQVLNSAITRPAHGETISLEGKDQKYRVQGYAYGSGSPIDRVEISLDEGESWIYCFRRYPKAPVRHGRKFWTWLHWHTDVNFVDLIQHKSIIVRCFDGSKNTQPEHPVWNVLGMMNNCWYRLKAEILPPDDEHGGLRLQFKHPVTPGAGRQAVEGWQKNSAENQVEAAKQNPEIGGQKRFTREEIEKHDTADDCWIVVDGKVYDATPVLSWHPGGAAPIMAHAGRVHLETSDEFNSIHDNFAREKMNECLIGVVSEKTAKFMEEDAKIKAEKKAKEPQADENVALRKDGWTPVRLIRREKVSEDTSTYTFQLPENKKILGLGTGQHLHVGFHLQDKMLTRPYTPTRPTLPVPEQARRDSGYADNENYHDGDGSFDLTVKTYYPTDEQPGGAMSNILDTVPIGEEVDVKGPSGEIIYNGNGDFLIERKQRHFDRVSLVLGGTGVTPGYSIIARIAMTEGDHTQLRIIDANKSRIDILMHDQLEEFQRQSNGRMKVVNVLNEPDEDWKGLTGFVTEDMMREHLFPPGEGSVALMCGPPVMIQKAVLPGLKNIGYVEGEDMFGF